MDPLRIYGLTGGIAAGKSTAARYFEKAGIPVVDADEIARELRKPNGLAHSTILNRFGTTDRAKLRKLVFDDTQARRDLEAILHPLIQAESLKRIQALHAPLVLYEAALLVETGRYRDFSGLIVVSANREQRLRRLMDRDQSSPEAAELILDSQGSDEIKLRQATFRIENSGSLPALQTQVQALAIQLLSRLPLNPSGVS